MANRKHPRLSASAAGWQRRIRSHPQAPLALVLTGVFVIVLDFFIVNVMLASMRSELHASSDAIEWVIAGCGVTFAAFLITAGRLGDRYGRRRIFSLGVSLFTLASLACSVAPNVATLILARLLQGVGAALISPNALSIIGVAYPGAARVSALRTYGVVMGLAAAGRPLRTGQPQINVETIDTER